MIISVNFNAYNKHRLHKPWISAVENWPSSQNPTVRWSRYQGDEDGGDVEIMATPGDVIRWGQKGPSLRQTCSFWGIVQEDGKLEKCSKFQAHKAWKKKNESKTDEKIKEKQSVTAQLAAFSDDQLLAEIRRRGLKP